MAGAMASARARPPPRAAASTPAPRAGAPQSNHVRMTAAAANKVGLHCTVVFGSDPPSVPSGNVILDELLGPEMVWAGPLDYYGVEAAIDHTTRRLTQEGRRPYAMPI